MDTSRNEEIAVAALVESVQQAIRSAAGVGPDRYVCFVDGGLALDAAHMTWPEHGPPFTPGADPQDHRADDAQSFARIADTIPAVGRPWSASANRIGPMFRSWLDAAVVPGSGLDLQEEQHLQEAAETIRAGAAAYHEHEQVWRKANAALQEVLHTRGTGPAHMKQVLERRRAAEGALQAWKGRGGKSRLETAMATQRQLSSRGLGQAMASLRERYDRVLHANCTRGGDHFTPVDLAPRDLFADAAGWAPVMFRPGELLAAPAAVSAMHGGGREMPLFWIREPHGPPVRAGGLDPSRLSISFELLHARIDRSAWFDSFLLMSRSWWWGDDGVVFSNGAPPPDTKGEWQMIPTGIVLVRNLTVDTGGAPATASELVRRAQSATAAGCWIFSLHDSIATPLSGGHDAMLLDGSRFAAPHVQIAAVVCQLMPREPDPDPALRQQAGGKRV